MGNNSAWAACEHKERHKTILLQFFLHDNGSMTHSPLLMGKSIYYILAPGLTRCGNCRVMLSSLKELNSRNLEDVSLLSHQRSPKDHVLNSLLCVLEF